MNYKHEKIKLRVDQVCRQWKRLILIKGGARFIIATLVCLAAAFILDSFFALELAIRLGLLALTAFIAVFVLYRELVRPLLNVPTQSQIARFLEEKHPHLQDRLVTAIELGDKGDLSSSQVIIEKLLEDTGYHLDPINLRQSVKSTVAVVWGNFAIVLLLALAGLFFSNISVFKMNTGRLFQPWQYPNVKPKPTLLVKPGNKRVLKGLSHQITAEITGIEVESAILYYSKNDSTWENVEMDPTNAENVFVFNLFNLQYDTQYYVRADNEISDIYQLKIYDAPRITQIDLTYKFPSYTGLSPRKEKDSGDIWAPEGTVVTITAYADKIIKSARFELANGRLLKTVVSDDSVVTAKLTVSEDTYYKIYITDTDNLTNPDPPEYYIHPLPDLPPVLTIERPLRDIRATMLEEVPLWASITDDYGVQDVWLKYVLNGEEEKAVKLQVKAVGAKSSGVTGSRKMFKTNYMIYFEDLEVTPGDFMSFYLETNSAKGKQEPVTSEIYFIEIRPFETEFTRPLSQGQMGGGKGAGGRLAQTQKEIIIATWKTLQKQSNLEKHRFEKNVNILAESQQNLQEVTQSTLIQLEQRSAFTRDVSNQVTKYYSGAMEAMQRAVAELNSSNLRKAQLPQRQALQNLLQAEAQIRKVQIQQSRRQTGGGNSATMIELSQLFEDELDKLNNKYETLNQAKPSQAEEELSEALKKVKELAKRQQHFNRQIRDLSRSESKKEENKHKIDELRREQERIRRETQQLARRMQQLEQQDQSLPREIRDHLRRATSEMNNASHNLRNENAELAAVKGTRALNRLNRLEDLLRRNQAESLRRQVNELEQQFQDLADRQRELTRDVEKLSNRQNATADALAASAKKQRDLREDAQRTTEQLKSLQKQSRTENSNLSRQIHRASREIAREDIEQKMQTAEQLLRGKKLSSARQAQKDVLAGLERSSKKMMQLRGALASSEKEKLDLALNQTRRFREQLEALQKQIEGMNMYRPDSPNGSQAANSETKTGKQQAGPGESGTPREELTPEQAGRINNDFARTLKNLEMIQNSLSADTSLTQKIRRLTRNGQSLLKSFGGGVPDRIQLIEQKILQPLHGLEAELAQKLELLSNREKLFIARDENIPRGYEELVEKYYEALSNPK